VRSRALRGIDAPEVVVETSLDGGLPGIAVVGLPEAAVRESRRRVKSAIQASHFEFPDVHVTVNLAPADLPKEGARFDLPIALSILARTGAVPTRALEGYEFVGELGLYGEMRAVRGALSAALATRAAGRRLIVPAENATEAALADGASVLGASHLSEVVGHLLGLKPLSEATQAPPSLIRTETGFARVRGQLAAKRALVVAAAGAHHLLLSGPPGAGKTLLARCLPGLLPPLSDDEAIEVVRIHSAAGLVDGSALPRTRPFREPHHTASAAALVGGGGRTPQPGEVSFAHHGVLFLDEFPEFDRRAIEALRQPLESGTIALARVGARLTLPARFQLVAAMNPCPAGRTCSRFDCSCGPAARERYAARLSLPILDRIDLRVDVPAVDHTALLAPAAADDDATVKATIATARAAQSARGALNGTLALPSIERHCRPDAAGMGLLEKAMARGTLTARGCHRVMRVARTIADLAGRETIVASDVAEALSYRGVSAPG
jgi:magnesium chelatase family protein